MSVFSERLIKAMADSRTSIYSLANQMGVSTSLIFNYRKGIYEPKHDNLILMGKILNVNPDYLLGKTDNPELTVDFGANDEAFAIKQKIKKELDTIPYEKLLDLYLIIKLYNK